MTTQSTHPPDRDNRGYRVAPGHGPAIRSDVVDVYIARFVPRKDLGTSEVGTISSAPSLELLQLLRSKEPLGGTWQPVMGHIEPGETAPRAALRELREEASLAGDDPALLGLWALEQVHPFYIAAIDCIVMSPRFVALVSPKWSPRLNAEHSQARWVSRASAGAHFMWPGQLAAIDELAHLLQPDSLAHHRQRIDIAKVV